MGLLLFISIIVNLIQWAALSYYKGYHDQKQRNRMEIARLTAKR